MFSTDQISKIVRSQLHTLLWSEGDLTDEHGNFTGETWDELFTADDATPELFAQLTEELEALNIYDPDFTADFVTALNIYYGRFSDDFLGQFGHDLALTRNRHGAGFWDRGLGEPGEVLTSWAESLGTLDVFKGSESIYPEKWADKFHAE